MKATPLHYLFSRTQSQWYRNNYSDDEEHCVSNSFNLVQNSICKQQLVILTQTYFSTSNLPSALSIHTQQTDEIPVWMSQHEGTFHIFPMQCQRLNVHMFSVNVMSMYKLLPGDSCNVTSKYMFSDSVSPQVAPDAMYLTDDSNGAIFPLPSGEFPIGSMMTMGHFEVQGQPTPAAPPTPGPAPFSFSSPSASPTPVPFSFSGGPRTFPPEGFRALWENLSKVGWQKDF